MTENQRYNVLLVGTDDAGGPDEAAAKLVARFRLSERVAAKLVRRLPAKVKKSVDQRQAEKYAKALRGLGMTVAVAKIGTTGDYEASPAGAGTPKQPEQPLMQDVMRDIPSSLGVAPDTGFNSEIEAFVRGSGNAADAAGPSFSIPGQIREKQAPRPVVEATLPMMPDASMQEPADGKLALVDPAEALDGFAQRFSGALDPALHEDAAADLGENDAVEDLFGVRSSPLDELASIDDAPEPRAIDGTRAMSPVDGFGPSAARATAGPGAAQPRKTAVEAPPSDWIERDHSFDTDAVEPALESFVTGNREAALEDTLAQLTGEHDAIPGPSTTEFDAVSARMESTLSLDESALPKTSRTPGVGPTTSTLRSYRNTDSFRPPPPRSRAPAILGLLAFFTVVGTGGYFVYQHWLSLQPPALFAAAEERFVLREVSGASVFSRTCAVMPEQSYLCRYDRTFLLNRFPEAVVPAVEQAANECLSSLRPTIHGVSEEMTCRLRLERGESRQIHRFDYHRNMSCEVPLTALDAGTSTRCRIDTETAHFVDGQVASDSREREAADYRFLRELELVTPVGELSLREYDVTSQDDGRVERAFFSSRHGFVVRRREMSGRAIVDIESATPAVATVEGEGSSDE